MQKYRTRTSNHTARTTSHTQTHTDALYQIVYPLSFSRLPFFFSKHGVSHSRSKSNLDYDFKNSQHSNFLQDLTLGARQHQFKYTFCLAEAEFVWPSMQTLVSRFDWVGPRILGPAPLIPTSPCLYCSLQVSIFCLCHWFVFWSVRVIYLHGIVFLSVPPQEIWNEAGLTLPGPKQSPRADLMYFDAFCENDTQLTAQTLRGMNKKRERDRERKKCTPIVSLVFVFLSNRCR